MRVLISGGLGHVGSSFIRQLQLPPNSKVYVCDTFLTQRYSSLFSIPIDRDVKFFEQDTRDITFDFLTSNQISHVIHLSAITDAAESFGKSEKLFLNNLGSTKSLINSCGEANVPIIFPSTTSVYGSNDELVDEDSNTNPQSPYAECKLLEEDLLKAAFKGGLRCVILRFGTIHGISSGMRFHTAVNKFCFQAVFSQPITVWKTAIDQKRPYLALSDANLAVEHVLINEILNGEVFNVLTENYSVNQILERIEKFLGKKLNVKFVESEIMNQLSYEVSNAKFLNTGFNFKGSLENDLKETVDLLSGAGIHGRI